MNEIKHKILTCARDCFLEDGLSHLSMRKVAGCVGVSATALYRHYADKEALLYQVIVQGFRIFAGYLQRVDKSQEPLRLLEQTAMAYLNFALTERAYYEMMFMLSEQMTGLKRINREGAAEVRGTFELLQQRVQLAIDADALERNDSYIAAYGFWAFAHGQISLHLCGKTGLEDKAFASTYRNLMREYLHR